LQVALNFIRAEVEAKKAEVDAQKAERDRVRTHIRHLRMLFSNLLD